MNFYRDLTAFGINVDPPPMVEFALYLTGHAAAGLIVLAVLVLAFHWLTGFPRWGRRGARGGRIGKLLPMNDRDD